MKKIVINGRFLLHRITGVERYAGEILKELDQIAEPGQLCMAVPPEVKDIPSYNNIRILKTGKLKNRLWEHISFPVFVWKQKGISLNLCNVAPLLSPGIVCLHDMKIKAVGEFFSKTFLLWYRMLFFNAVRRAKAIITVSEFSKKEIGRYYHTDPRRITVIPNAWQHYEKIGYAKDALAKYRLEEGQYYFSMSSLEPNKNMKWIAEAARRNPEQTFAVAGAVNEVVFAKGFGFTCPQNMRLLGYVTDEEAKTLMCKSKAFLFPTLYEGFGIPPLEALSAGARQVIVSDTEVMHEIFGESVVYINPYTYDCGFQNLSDGEACSARAILERFSWRASAEKLYKLLKEI